MAKVGDFIVSMLGFYLIDINTNDLRPMKCYKVQIQELQAGDTFRHISFTGIISHLGSNGNEF